MDNITTKSVRAIASTMVRQFLTPFIIAIFLLLLAAIVLVIVLSVNYSSWWLVSLFVLVPFSLVFALITAGLWFIYRKITPTMSKAQAKAVNQFTDRVAGYSDLVGTPRFMIAFRVVRDVIRKRPRKYVGELVDSSTELKRDFEAVRHSFKA